MKDAFTMRLSDALDADENLHTVPLVLYQNDLTRGLGILINDYIVTYWFRQSDGWTDKHRETNI